MASPLDSTYGIWLIAFYLGTFLYGIGVLQTWIYFAGRPTDHTLIKITVLVALMFETIQVTFFFRSTFFRFVERFGLLQLDLIWADSLHLLAGCLSAFTVQIFFFSRIYTLTRGHGKRYAIGNYTILALAAISLFAGIAQTILSYKLRSFPNLGETKPVNTLQAAASFACDLLITAYLCIILHSKKRDIIVKATLMDDLIRDAINRGALTALFAALTLILFLTLPDTFWFFLGLALSSKFYVNSMLATLNRRQRIRDEIASNNKGRVQEQTRLAGVDFETTSVEDCSKVANAV